MKRLLVTLALVATLGARGYCGHVDTIGVFSAAMHKMVPCVVILPDRYEQTQTAYPVVYLLHGYSGNYLNWITKVPELRQYVDQYHLIIVCPDGGFSSWYFDSPLDSTYRYETFMARELVADIDARYRTIPDRSHRGICGLSMGGHGALFLAIRHKNEFGSAVAISGGVDLMPFPHNWDIAKRLGDQATHRKRWEQYSVINLVDSLANGELHLALDDGTHDIFIKENRALHAKLLKLHITHDYIERPGGHNWDYWCNAIPYELLFFSRVFYPRP